MANRDQAILKLQNELDTTNEKYNGSLEEVGVIYPFIIRHMNNVTAKLVIVNPGCPYYAGQSKYTLSHQYLDFIDFEKLSCACSGQLVCVYRLILVEPVVN